jgi:ribosome maturation factor RimP
MDLTEEIRNLAEAGLAPGQFVVDVLVSARKGPTKVTVLVDGDNGFTIDDCAELSRQLSKAFDEKGLIDEHFTLEVSTPGLDHPLTLKRQYQKNIGRGLKVKLRDAIEEGKLTEVSEEKITLIQEVGSGKKKETKTIEIPFSDIDKAFVVVSFK